MTGCDDVVVADGLMSGTRHVNEAALYIGSTQINLVDTPGFNDSELEDEDIYYKLLDWLKAFHERGQKFSGLLYLHPINKTREKGSDVRSLKVFRRLVGESNYNNIVIGLTFCDLESPEVVASRERTLRESPDFWASMIAAGASVTRISSDKDECIALVARMAQMRTVNLQATKEMFEENRTAAQTSGMEEMQDHEELKMIRMREEMEQAAQKTLFDERLRLTCQFSEERAALEQQLFEAQEAKQVLEEEMLTWKGACEKEQEDCRSMKLQYDRAEVLRKQKEEHVKREEKAREGKLKLEKAKSENEERLDKEHAMRQIAKIMTYSRSKFALFIKMRKSASADLQKVSIARTSKGADYFAGLHCMVCWVILPPTEPILGEFRSSFSTLGSSGMKFPD